MKLFPKIGLCIQSGKTLKQDLKDTLLLCQNFGSELHLLISEKANIDARDLDAVLSELDPGDLVLHKNFLKGESAQAILKVNEQVKFDLLIVPALLREGLIRYYTGSLARQLVQWANCSVLLIKPSNRRKAKSYGQLVCNLNKHPKSAHTLFVASEIAKGLELKPWHIAIHTSDEGNYQYFESIKSKVHYEEEAVEMHYLKQRTGYSLSNSAEKHEADLLLINSPDTKLGYTGRMIGDDLEYLFSELPSDLMLVHSFNDPKFR